jgi:hypothetical protein
VEAKKCWASSRRRRLRSLVEFAEPARGSEDSIGGIPLLGSVAAWKGEFPIKIAGSCPSAFSCGSLVRFVRLILLNFELFFLHGGGKNLLEFGKNEINLQQSQ